MNEQVDSILEKAFNLKASDIHLTVGVPPVFQDSWRTEAFWGRHCG